MEPRPHERGKSSRKQRQSRQKRSFNGATSSRTWKAGFRWFGGSRYRRLQWSHVLTNVERLPVRQMLARRQAASMEPRPHERGKVLQATDLDIAVEATLTLQWSHVLTNVERKVLACRVRRQASFNGATSSRTWKGGLAGFSSTVGLRFNGATSSRTWKVTPGRYFWDCQVASMEPRPHERGKVACQRRSLSHCPTLQWSHVLTNVESRRASPKHFRRQSASMEPRPHERGKLQLIERMNERERLQWSHVLTNVERVQPSRPFRFVSGASMEPRPHERGKINSRRADCA